MAQTALYQLLLLTPFLFLLLHINAQSSTAPAPAPAGPINVTAILEKSGQFSTFIRFLDETQIGNQINTQINSSNEGRTVFAPTDNAFQNIQPGALNKLSDQQQVQLVLYHVLPKYYTLTNLQTVSNPVRTLATGQDGGVFGLNFTGQSNQNQVNVSSGMVDTPIYNVVRKDFPLAVYQVDKVLWPMEFNETKKASPPAASPPTSNSTKSDSSDGKTAAENPSPSGNVAKSLNVGLSLISGLWLLCMGVLF